MLHADRHYRMQNTLSRRRKKGGIVLYLSVTTAKGVLRVLTCKLTTSYRRAR